jgi:hypothetical protein
MFEAQRADRPPLNKRLRAHVSREIRADYQKKFCVYTLKG